MFSTVIVYVTVSPKLAPAGATSLVIAATLTASILGASGISVSVGSSLPVASVGSSLSSLTAVPVTESVALATAWFVTIPALISA